MELPDPKPGVVATAYARPLGLVLVVAGVVHLAVPRTAVRVVGAGYDLVLDVEFEAGERTPRRVRAVGLALIAVGAHLVYHGGVVPGD